MKTGFKIGQWLIEPELNLISCSDKKIHLEPKVMEVLLLLTQEPEVVFSKEKLITTVWQNTFVTEQVLTNAIWELRKALGDDAKSPTYIQTVPKKGYRLIASISNTVTDPPVVEEILHQNANRIFFNARRNVVFVGTTALLLTVFAGLLIWRNNSIVTSPKTPQATSHQEVEALYAKGLERFNRRTEADLQESLKYFEEIIQLDSTYAPVYASLAVNYVFLVPKTLRPRDGYSKAKSAALKALEINPNSSEAHGALGIVKLLLERNWTEAEAEFQQAISLNPENALARTWYAQYLMAANRLQEAAEQINEACRLVPNSLHAQATAGDIFLRAKQDDEAIKAYQKVLEIDHNYIPAHNGLGNIYQKRLLLEQARYEYQKALELMGEPKAATMAKDFISGEKPESELLVNKLDVLLKQKNVPPTQIAQIFARFNERDKAFYWLEKGYEEMDTNLMLLKIDNSWDNLRGDPRFTSLMQRVGITN